MSDPIPSRRFPGRGDRPSQTRQRVGDTSGTIAQTAPTPMVEAAYRFASNGAMRPRGRRAAAVQAPWSVATYIVAKDSAR